LLTGTGRGCVARWIAEAARSGTGKLFFDKIAAFAFANLFIPGRMHGIGTASAGTTLNLGCDHLGALLEAEILEPLLFTCERPHRTRRNSLAARRAVAAS